VIPDHKKNMAKKLNAQECFDEVVVLRPGRSLSIGRSNGRDDNVLNESPKGVAR
jgi:hypothetical protein